MEQIKDFNDVCKRFADIESIEDYYNLMEDLSGLDILTRHIILLGLTTDKNVQPERYREELSQFLNNDMLIEVMKQGEEITGARSTIDIVDETISCLEYKIDLINSNCDIMTGVRFALLISEIREHIVAISSLFDILNNTVISLTGTTEF